MDDCEIRSRLRGLGLQEKADYLGYRECSFATNRGHMLLSQKENVLFSVDRQSIFEGKERKNYADSFGGRGHQRDLWADTSGRKF